MIYEFALEPELVAACHGNLWSRFLYDNFGLGRSRTISDTPERWSDQVWSIFLEKYSTNQGVDKNRMFVLINDVLKPTMKRKGLIWNEKENWQTNIDRLNSQAQFDEIVSHQMLGLESTKNLETELDRIEISSKFLAIISKKGNETDVVVDRKAQKMANLVYPMLRIASEIKFVDPYFSLVDNFLNAFEKYLEIVGNQHSHPSISVHTVVGRGSKQGKLEFSKNCKNELHKIIPNGQVVKVIQWEEIENGEQFHNRYILTENGGVNFSIGLDEQKNPEREATDDVSILSREQFNKRWDDISFEPYAFKLIDQLEVMGSKIIK